VEIIIQTIKSYISEFLHTQGHDYIDLNGMEDVVSKIQEHILKSSNEELFVEKIKSGWELNYCE
jgi:hypothetical protein